MLCGYLDAAVAGDITIDRVHISAVLDHDRRSITSAFVSIICSAALVSLEVTRSECSAEGPKETPYSRERISLATCCGGGILIVCLVRESSYFFVHAVAAATAFGCAVMLVWVVALSMEDRSLRRRALRLAFMLSVVCTITGMAQAGSIFEVWSLPSALLALGEWFLVLGFAICVAVI